MDHDQHSLGEGRVFCGANSNSKDMPVLHADRKYSPGCPWLLVHNFLSSSLDLNKTRCLNSSITLLLG